MFKLATLCSLVLVTTVNAHVALWDKGMFGYNYPDAAGSATQNYNTNDPVVPLRQDMNLAVSQWFGRGMLGLPPIAGDFMQLPAGGTYKGELACNRADSKLRDPRRTDAQPVHACGGEGALHVVNNLFNSTKALNTTWFGGTALAIAYTSDVKAVKPSDMTVISVNTVSPWYRNTDYKIPAGLPACPSGGCLCTWNWIHQANHGEGYPYEIYNNMYRCKVTSPGTGKVVGKPQPAKLCAGSSSTCVKGPKQPNYVWMASGNNQASTEDPPTYNSRYGFVEGAQNDIFVTATSTSKAATSTSKAATSTSKAASSTSRATTSRAASSSKAATSTSKAPTSSSKAATSTSKVSSTVKTAAVASSSTKAKRTEVPMGMNRLRAHPRHWTE